MFFPNSPNKPRPDCNNACPNQIVHIIQAGDTVYNLSVRHRTTVDAILALNPGIDVYNLQIGSKLIICPGVFPVPPIAPLPPVRPVPPIGTFPCTDALRDLVTHILRWIREQFGENDFRRMMEEINDGIWAR